MKNSQVLEEMIVDRITFILHRSTMLKAKDKKAISQEYKEWLYGDSKVDDVLIVGDFTW